MLRPVLLAVGLVSVVCCTRTSSDNSPAGVLTRFLDAMDRSSVDARALQEAYTLLDAQAREALDARARLAANLSGQPFEPWQMLVQGRFRLRFDPGARMRAKVDGDVAVVTVESEDHQQSAHIQTVREDGRWRIRLEIPRQAAPTEPASRDPDRAPGG